MPWRNTMDKNSLASFKTFGDLLRFLRQRERMSQRALSIAVGYSDAHINRLEKGSRAPDLDVVRARFVPALHLDDEPEVAARLIELARQRPDAGAGVGAGGG